MADIKKAKELATAYAESNERDVLLISGPMGHGLDGIIHECLSHKKYTKLLLILTTEGGDAHAAYRVARHLQRVYEHVSVFVCGWCKSAGTLLAVCGHELIVGDKGELGPVDVQRGRTDDLWESTSGLTETAAVTTLEEISWSLFRKLVTETKDLSRGQITFKTAAEAAAPLVSGMLKPIFAQIDPLKLGENARALRIASEYAHRLNEHAKNLVPRSDSIDSLISGYPDHGFVIDRKEAQSLFQIVKEPCAELCEISTSLGEVATYPSQQPVLTFLNIQKADSTQSGKEKTNGQQATSVSGDGTAEQEHTSADSNSDATMAAQASQSRPRWSDIEGTYYRQRQGVRHH